MFCRGSSCFARYFRPAALLSHTRSVPYQFLPRHMSRDQFSSISAPCQRSSSGEVVRSAESVFRTRVTAVARHTTHKGIEISHWRFFSFIFVHKNVRTLCTQHRAGDFYCHRVVGNLKPENMLFYSIITSMLFWPAIHASLSQTEAVMSKMQFIRKTGQAYIAASNAFWAMDAECKGQTIVMLLVDTKKCLLCFVGHVWHRFLSTSSRGGHGQPRHPPHIGSDVTVPVTSQWWRHRTVNANGLLPPLADITQTSWRPSTTLDRVLGATAGSLGSGYNHMSGHWIRSM